MSVLRPSSLAAVTSLVRSRAPKPSPLRDSLTSRRTRRRSDSLRVPGRMSLLQEPSFSRLLLRPSGARSSAMPFSTFRAVRTPARDTPISTRVIATDGCMPTSAVSASITRATCAMAPNIRAMKESTTSSAEISMRTPRARVVGDAVGEVVLEHGREPVVHVHLDGDQEELAHAEDWNAFHGSYAVSPRRAPSWADRQAPSA